jgi:hypothetical protein
MMPGMPSTRRCACGNLLAPDDGERCIDCKPRLSAAAQAVGEACRRRDDEIAAMEREERLLATTIHRVQKRINRWEQRRSSGLLPTSGQKF